MIRFRILLPLCLAAGGAVLLMPSTNGMAQEKIETPKAAEAELKVPEPEGYRLKDYSGPTPETVEGGTVVDTAEARALWEEGEAIFVDVLPQPPRPQNLPETEVWRPTPRHDIPRSIWLADTGYGDLAPAMETYLKTNLEEATGGDKSVPLVFYCKRDCWMSYNAAKRVAAYGYENVNWYPGGTDGWAEAGYDLVETTPEPRPGE